MTKEQVLELKCVKHVKVYKLKQLGLSNKEIAEILETNQGHIWNVLNKYSNDSKLIESANSI